MMKIYPSWFSFFLFFSFGLMLVLCGGNWFIIWLGFELTLLCFLPMFMGGSLLMESLVKYFLVQVGGSSLFAFSFLTPISFLSGFFLLMGMFMKLGLFPFFSWVPMVMSSLSWAGCFFIVSFQKIAPLIVIGGTYYLDSMVVFFSGVMGVLVSGLFGYNQTYMRSLMAYSSIGHTSWLTVALMMNLYLFFLYFFIYFFLVFFLFMLFSQFGFNKIYSSGLGFTGWGVIVFFMLSLSGLPPFSVFFLKLGVLLNMVDFYFYVPFFLLGSLLSIYYYLTFVLSSLPVFWGQVSVSVIYILFFGLVFSILPLFC